MISKLANIEGECYLCTVFAQLSAWELVPNKIYRNAYTRTIATVTYTCLATPPDGILLAHLSTLSKIHIVLAVVCGVPCMHSVERALV